ncbi:MAG: peptidase domain-containing ABC transporter [Myxococcota bacterium]
MSARVQAVLRALQVPTRRRRTPFVPQLLPADCGAACLAMVLGHHGEPARLDEVREQVDGGRDGTTAFQLLEGARTFGLRARGLRLADPADLQFLQRPAILHWEMRHFVVFDGLERGGVAVLDPAVGRRWLSLAEFGQAFTGIALVFEPTDAFRPRPAAASRGWPYVRAALARAGQWPRILVTSLLLQLLGLGLPILTGLIVDRVVPRHDLDLLWLAGAGLAGVVGFQLLTTLVRNHLLLHLRTVVDARLTVDFVGHLMDLPYAFFQQRPTGDLLMRLNSNTVIREMLTSGLLSGLLDGGTVVFGLALLLVWSPAMGLLALVLGAAQLAVPLVTWRRQAELMSRSLVVQARASSFQVEMIGGVETLKAMGVEARSVEAWNDLFVDVLNVSIARGHLDAATQAVQAALRVGGPLAVLWIGAWWVAHGWSTVGAMLALCALVGSVTSPVDRLATTFAQVQLFGSYFARIDDVLRVAPEQVPLAPEGDEQRAPARPAPRLTGRIALEGVCFGYGPRSPDVVEDLSLAVEPGEFLAIVGRSGSGKSTLARLLTGLYRPRAGRVRYDGADLADLDLHAVRRQIGIVGQDTHLFGRSIRENIALGDPAVPLDAVEAAARRACIHDEIAAMPMGYETVLHDGGRSLSGGQRQRLALARALLRDPVVLLLDEATSALDAATEALVQAQLEQLRCTRVVIAHRLSTVRRADRIVVLDRGALVEAGPHDALVAQRGPYAELVVAQLR